MTYLNEVWKLKKVTKFDLKVCPVGYKINQYVIEKQWCTAIITWLNNPFNKAHYVEI